MGFFESGPLWRPYLCERGISVKGIFEMESLWKETVTPPLPTTPQPTLPPVVTEVGNMHPTGMYTCFYAVSAKNAK